MGDPHAVLNVVPTLIPTADGSWLAVSGPDSPVRVGALEETEELARSRFQEAVVRVVDALKRTDPVA